MKKMIASIVLLALIGHVFAGSCPSDKSTIDGCECTDSRLTCRDVTAEELDGIFSILTGNHNPGDQRWDYFYLSSNEIDSLPDGVFHCVWFRNIILDNNPKLSCVGPRAFSNGMAQWTINFLSTSNSFSVVNATCNVFKALSDLFVLEVSNVTHTQITDIPKGAFQGVSTRQEHLRWIDLSSRKGGVISHVGENAFAGLKVIERIDLSGNNISKVDNFAFSFREPFDRELYITLENNAALTGDSFGGSAFEIGERRVNLRLGANKGLMFLKRETFLPILQKKDVGQGSIDLEGSFLDYCQENEWLHTYRAQLNLDKRLTNVLMVDGQSFWKQPPSKFANGKKCSTTFYDEEEVVIFA